MTPLLLAGQPNTRTCCFSRASQTGATLIRYCHSKISNRGQQRGRSCKVVCKNGAQHASEVVQAGDTATIHFTAYGEQGQRLESTKDAGQALNFEVGSSNAVGNDLLQIFDEGIVGMRVGEQWQDHEWCCESVLLLLLLIQVSNTAQDPFASISLSFC